MPLFPGKTSVSEHSPCRFATSVANFVPRKELTFRSVLVREGGLLGWAERILFVDFIWEPPTSSKFCCRIISLDFCWERSSRNKGEIEREKAREQLPLWAPEKNVYVPHFLKRKKARRDPHELLRRQFGAKTGAQAGHFGPPKVRFIVRTTKITDRTLLFPPFSGHKSPTSSLSEDILGNFWLAAC